LNEAESTLPLFLEDLRLGRQKQLYTTQEWADLSRTPLPKWELIDMSQYATMNIQYSRGCPYDCEFCDITVLYGRLPRTKTGDQVVAEMEALYEAGWREHLFFVDDNFIGNRVKLKTDVLPRMTTWMEERGYPFALGTEASLNLSDDPVLLDLMAHAGFEEVFVGIETPNEASLEECKKVTNKNRDLLASVRKLQSAGLQVQAGFIVGFDHDPLTIFDTLIRFIRESGIVIAMVGLLNAPVNSRLYNRLGREERLLKNFTGDNTDFTMNFVPKMDPRTLTEGYRKILGTIYSPREYYKRVISFLKAHEPLRLHGTHIRAAQVRALLKSMILLGVVGKERVYYWRLFFWTLIRRPRHFSTAITFAIYGFHFRRVFEQYL
jgi:radical SAM superfamily enzyme YgiQ (UPF0313 family)